MKKIFKKFYDILKNKVNRIDFNEFYKKGYNFIKNNRTYIFMFLSLYIL